MRTFRFRSASVAMALIVGVTGGAQIAGVKPAIAQAPAFVITAKEKAGFVIKAGEKVQLAKMFDITQQVPSAQIFLILVSSSPGVQINGLERFESALPFSSLDGLLTATVTATKSGAVIFSIDIRNPTEVTPVRSFGGTFVKFVDPLAPTPAQAIGIVPLASPPAIRVGEKVPLSRFLTTNVNLGLQPKIKNIAFQTFGGAQLNGLSSGAILPPLVEVLAAASVTGSSDGGITILIDYDALPPEGGISVLGFQIQGSILVRFVPLATPVPPPATVAPPPTPTPATVAPPPTPAGGAPPAGGANRAPVAQSVQLIATAGAFAPLVLSATDPDANALTFVVVQFPAHGKLSGQAPNLQYTPDSGFLGTDALIFTATDGTASSAQATVTITVTGKAASIAKTVRKVIRKTVKKTTKKR